MIFRILLALALLPFTALTVYAEEQVPQPDAAAALAASQTDVPAELKGIVDLLDKEDEVVKAAREFQSVQSGLAYMEDELARVIALKGASDQAEKEAQEKLDSAQRRRANIAKAWEMVHAKYPDNPLAMTFYGSILYYELGRQDEAVMLWKRASVVNDKLPEPINELYIHYFHVGDYANGWEAMEKVRKLAPDDPDVLFNLAQTFLTYAPQVKQRYEWNDKKVYEEAMKCSKKAAEKLPQDFQVLQDYANNFYAAENFGVEADWKDALEAWSKARAYAPNEYNVFYCWLNEARCAIRKGDKSHATTALGEALKIEPESKAANNLLATLDSQIEKHAGTNKSNDAKKSNEKKPKREKKDRS